MNRLISTNLSSVTPDRLPTDRREGAVRMLFIHGNILGFRNVAEQLKRYTAEREDIDAMHIDLFAPLWMKVIGKSFGPTGAWDFHPYRYLHLWSGVMRRWFRTALPLERFDVIHVMTQVNAWALMSIPRERRPPVAINIDATAMQDVTEFGRSRIACAPFIAAERRMFRDADLIVCRNAWAAGSLRAHYQVPDQRIHLAQNSLAVSPTGKCDQPAEHDGPVRIAFVGNNWKRKGGDLVLRVHQAHLADRAELHVFGRRVREDSSARNVTWHGFVPRKVLLEEMLPTMDIFVLASRFDMLPWAALEAAGIGLPIVAPRVGGLPEVVIDEETGLLFEPESESALRAALDRLIGSAELRGRMSRAARAHMSDHFNPDQTYPELLDRLISLAAEGRR